MFDPRQRPQMQGGGGWGQNNPWLAGLAQQLQARQGGQRGPAVGPGMPGPGGVPQPMPPGPGLQPQPGAAPPQGGGQFGGNPAFLQQLAQRVPQQGGAPQAGPPMPQGGAPGYPRPSFAMPQSVTPGNDAPEDTERKRY